MAEGTNKGNGKRSKAITCDDCYFRRNGLCALQLSEPCPTFRPYSPDGLKPPRQLVLMPRQERMPQRLVAFRQPG